MARIIIVTQNAYLYIPIFMDRFCARLSKTEHKIIGIVTFPPYHRSNFWGEILFRYQLYGTIDFFRMSCMIFWNQLLALLYPLNPKASCRSVDNVIQKYNLRKIKIKEINLPNFIRFIKGQETDLLVSIACPKIFKKELITAPKLGCINYHSALLPRYRGLMPLFWALLNGEKEIGVTAHFIDEKIDNGPIVHQEKIVVSPEDSLHTLYLKTIEIGPKVLMEAIEKIAGGDHWIENNSAFATYHGYPTAQEAQLFRKMGKKFF